MTTEWISPLRCAMLMVFTGDRSGVRTTDVQVLQFFEENLEELDLQRVSRYRQVGFISPGEAVEPGDPLLVGSVQDFWN